MAFMPVSQKAFCGSLFHRLIAADFSAADGSQAPGVTSLEAPFVPLINKDGGI